MFMCSSYGVPRCRREYYTVLQWDQIYIMIKKLCLCVLHMLYHRVEESTTPCYSGIKYIFRLYLVQH